MATLFPSGNPTTITYLISLAPGQVKTVRLLRAQASAIVKELRKDEDKASAGK